MEDKFLKRGQTDQTIHMNQPKEFNYYNPKEGIGYKSPCYLKRAISKTPTLYDLRYMSLGYKIIFMKESGDPEQLKEIEKKEKARKNKQSFPFNYSSLNASYATREIPLTKDYTPSYTEDEMNQEVPILEKVYKDNQTFYEKMIAKLEVELEDERRMSLMEKDLFLSKINELEEALKSKSTPKASQSTFGTRDNSRHHHHTWNVNALDFRPSNTFSQNSKSIVLRSPICTTISYMENLTHMAPKSTVQISEIVSDDCTNRVGENGRSLGQSKPGNMAPSKLSRKDKGKDKLVTPESEVASSSRTNVNVPKKNKRFRKRKNATKPKEHSHNFTPKKNTSHTHSPNVKGTNRGSQNVTDQNMRNGRHKNKESGSREGSRPKPFAHKPSFMKNNFSNFVYHRTNRHVPRTPFQCYECEHIVYGCHSNFRCQNQFRFGYCANAFVNDYFVPNYHGFYNRGYHHTHNKKPNPKPKQKSPPKGKQEPVSKPANPNQKGPIPKWVPKNVYLTVMCGTWIQGVSKHMTGRKELLANFKQKYGGNVRFGNKLSAPIMGYGDILHHKITINKVAYVEGLSHNLLSIGKFCDKGLEVNFRETRCCIRTFEGNELIEGTRRSNLYTVNFQKQRSFTEICLLSKATFNQNVLWHRRLSHLNYATINQLAKAGLVIGLPSLKFTKEQLCSACKMGKIKKSSHKLKVEHNTSKPLQLLHMDLCGPMRVQSINGRKYVLVIVDDFSRIWRPWNGKVRKKARKREKCTKSTQKTLGDREVPYLAPPSSTEVQIRPPPSVLDMSFEVRYTRGIQRNESESTKGADTLRKLISDHLLLYCRNRLLSVRMTANRSKTQVNPKVENAKTMLMITGELSKKKWTDIYTKKYVETESESEPDYATDYDSEGFTVSFEHLRLKVPEASSEDDDEEDGKQGGYAEFVIPKKEDKGKEKEKEKEKAPEDDLIYIAPIKHDPGSYNLPISCHKFSGLALVDSGAALNMMPVCYCRKMGVKRIVPTNYQYRGVNGYMTTPLGIAEGVPIRIGKFVYYTDFVIANLPQNTEIPIILGRSFLHTAQVNTDMRNQVTSLGYGDNRIYFDPNGEPVRHLDEPYDDPSLAYTKSMSRPPLPHELGKKTEDYSNPMHKKGQSTKEPGSSKKDHRRKKGSSSRRAKK
ncbi:hypothetical protein OSB04_031418 [Centaurea solstitialis]|uniref:GAG-pre-integrase domain-containing protein n=1 Tax=Centaurea solstitialis TaxID=347529 RepID=A0AA38W4Q6_9ASTR|nr:hypothetical protein OSB04_031418 [Centaurea solstitialis]